MSYATTEYTSIGGNRHSAAADWSRHSGHIAFGADQNIAIWPPLQASGRGISAILRGPTGKISAVKYLLCPDLGSEILIAGSANGEIWCWKETQKQGWVCLATAKGHGGAVNAIAVLDGMSVFATGGAEATVKLWKASPQSLSLIYTIKLIPRYIPLTMILGTYSKDITSDSIFLAAGGTRNIIQVFSITQIHEEPRHEVHATLSGHEGWIRSLALRIDQGGDLLLASASHDKYVRLWRLHRGDHDSVTRKSGDRSDVSLFEQTLTSKVQTVGTLGKKYSITFEALLLGHEDWIYSASWNMSSEKSQLLTASADGSLTIWEPDPSSGIWVSATRLGEISGQKGATTATGSAGGFWIGLWSPDGQAVTCIGKTGSWRVWQHNPDLQYWVQKPGISGHIGPVNGLSWSKCGSYLLSTSSDQSTRLHAEWRRDNKRTWHEFARPQIHGYDLNCVASLNPQRFVSGADEKLLRVFDEPRPVASMLHRLCNIDLPPAESLPDAANMPVLGLSNKAVDDFDSGRDAENGKETSGASSMLFEISEPPTEDLLARHTLWPEQEKLYGHGYEISETASSDFCGTILATACKASSIDHALIRLYDTSDWREIKPPLSAHSLTVTRLSYSPHPEGYLLSVGRDRQWTLFRRETTDHSNWKLCQSNAKAHSRMILDCAWAPGRRRLCFATAGRDKTVKIWAAAINDSESIDFTCHATVKRGTPVTAVAFTTTQDDSCACLAVGEEDGQISLHLIEVSMNVQITKSVELEAGCCPSKVINRLSWRPNPLKYSSDGKGSQLAVAAGDGSVRILRVDVDRMYSD